MVGDPDRAWLIACHYFDGMKVSSSDSKLIPISKNSNLLPPLSSPSPISISDLLDTSNKSNVITSIIPPSPPSSYPFFVHTSKRGFLTLTGRFKGIPISICAIGMGVAMMDFFLRETRRVVKGPLVILRFGSSGGITKSVRAGQINVAEGACLITRKFSFIILYLKEF